LTVGSVVLVVFGAHSASPKVVLVGIPSDDDTPFRS
jgi:hypothetical protein